jgi:hypothetical protein
VTKRYLPVLTGLALVLVVGVASGVWTQRWRRSSAMVEAAARLERCPTDIGDWTSEPMPVEAEALARLNAEGAWQRRYKNLRTKQELTVLLMVGPTGAMCKHRPEHCYAGAGFFIDEAAYRQEVNAGDGQKGVFWSARFTKYEAGTVQRVRVRYAWLAGDRWQAPDSPRWAFLGQPFLYKLYVIRELSPGTEHPEEDPSNAFLDLFVPALTKTLRPE